MSVQPISQSVSGTVAPKTATNATGASQAVATVEKKALDSSPEKARADEARGMSQPEKVEAAFSPTASKEVGDSTVESESNERRNVQEENRHKLDLKA